MNLKSGSVDQDYLFSEQSNFDISDIGKSNFIENRGQIKNPDVKFYSSDGSIWFTDDGIWFQFIKPSKNDRKSNSNTVDLLKDTIEYKERSYSQNVICQRFVGANSANPMGKLQQVGKYNYFYGNDSSKWKSNIHSYKEIYYQNIYNGIDLRYFQSENGLKYDFIVKPGADLQNIRIKYEGIDELHVVDDTNLLIRSPFVEMIDRDLFIYQPNERGLIQIDGKFIKSDHFEYGFGIVDNYNKDEALIIDPNIILDYSTYLGGINWDRAEGIAVDSIGNVYVGGPTMSPNFPTTAGVYNRTFNNGDDVFVTKLNPSATDVIFSTFIGGSSDDTPFDLEIDSQGNSYVTGRTWSNDFPTTSGAYDDSKNNHFDIIIVKLNHDGSQLLYSSYFGHDNRDYAYDIEVDSKGEVYITGDTLSSQFPTTPFAYDRNLGLLDCYVTKINLSTSTLIFSTFIGGSDDDYGYDIEMDSNGDVYVAGYTASDVDFPTNTKAFNRTFNGGTFDAFIFKLEKNGTNRGFGTYFGGSNSDQAYGLELDDANNIYITGWTRSVNFPTTAGANDTTHGGWDDAFVAKINHNGTKLLYSTFIGGSRKDVGHDIALDSSGSILMTGLTNSNNFPVSSDAYDPTHNLEKDSFFSVLSGNFQLMEYSTYLGGSGNDTGKRVIQDTKGNAYLVGYTDSNDFSTTAGVINESHNGDDDGFISKFILKPAIKINSMKILSSGESTNLLYSRLEPYNFKIDVIDTASANDVKDVFLTIDPTGINIQLKWNRTSNQFSKSNDPNDYVIIDSSSDTQSILHQLTLNFNLIFNWNFPDENMHDIQVYATSNLLRPAWFNGTGVFRVENDLCFNGSLLVTGEDNRVINKLDIVRGGEKLTWTGLKAVYEGTDDVYPPEEEYDITIWDENDNCWSDSPGTGENCSIQTITPKILGVDSLNYRINISGIPDYCDATDDTFQILIDSHNVTFSNPIPDNRTWHREKDVTVGITIKDMGGALVNGSSIRHSVSTDNGYSWSDWQLIDEVDSAASVDVSDTVTLENGMKNLIRWHAEDTVRNGPGISKNYRILVDDQNVSFKNPVPSYTYESYYETVEVGITITDAISGVNASTIEYTISYDEGGSWSPWNKVTGFTNDNEITIKLNATFKNGTANRIMWRASDIAGNGPVNSEIYTVRVNTWLYTLIPKVKLQSPENGSTISDNSVELNWVLLNSNLNGVTYDIYLDTENPPEELEKINLPDSSLKIEKLQENVLYFWTVIPKTSEDTGLCLSGVWSFKVDLNVSVPKVNLISPSNGMKLNTLRPKLQWELVYGGIESVTYDIYLDHEFPPKRIIEGHSSMEFTPSEDLEDDTKYYWNIVPVAGDIKGTKSPIRWFVIDKDYDPYIEFEMKLIPETIEVEQGEIKSIKIEVTNLGDLTDTIYLDHDIPSLSGINIDINGTGLLVIEPYQTSYFYVMITVDESAKAGEVFVIFTGTSGKSIDYGDELQKSKTLKVQVIKPGTSTSDELLSNTLVFSIITITIVIIICIILFLFISKRKKRITAEVEYIPPPIKPTIAGSGTAQGDMISAPVITAEYIQKEPQADQLPGGVDSKIPAQQTPMQTTESYEQPTAQPPTPSAVKPPQPQLPSVEDTKSTTQIPKTKPVVDGQKRIQKETDKIEQLFDFDADDKS